MSELNRNVELRILSQANYTNVENIQIGKESFQNSQYLYSLFDNDNNGILDDDEINNYLYTIDASDGQYDGALNQESINKYISNSNFNEAAINELVDFNNQIYGITQGYSVDMDLYSTLDITQEQKATTPNGKIDDFSQGSVIGDCWLLSQAQAISSTSWGEEMIYNSIKQNTNGDYIVSFEGVDEEINITKDELNAAYTSGQYSRGDADMILLEVAMEKYLSSHIEDNNAVKQKNNLALQYSNQGNPYNILSGNYLTNETSLQYVYTKEKGTTYDISKSKQEVYVSSENYSPENTNSTESNNNTNINADSSIEEILKTKAQNPSSCALVCDLNIEDNIDGYKSRGLINNHAYSVSSAFDENGQINVILTNPHYTSSPIQISYSEFTNIARNVGVIEEAQSA